ncbi:isopenicillin N synthase family dioxygenase [Dactylosporangium matsuzakiense]|uniref:isopenicillin N synthase family dioxygenase n=1 Tax=Dactylosporangium matsuzakiense TaxID=53360 RepID=UPI0021C407D0|nr:2-oxoglutarate and iron-dependent oxygenase domain-containing protein [Dactylosporangium matsuzakiense]
MELPVIDIAGLVRHGEDSRAAAEIADACRASGFFYVAGHGVDAGLIARLDSAAREFFALPEDVKAEIAMHRGGRAWRGFFPVGGELTSGVPDRKEGLYFGTELGPDSPQVRARLPLHGANLFPRQVPGLREAVLEYIEVLTRTAQAVLRGVAGSLGLDANYFADGYTRNPTVLFRIFHYPPSPPQATDWGVGEHTDYGLLTLLLQDDNGGLQVKRDGGWIDAPPIDGTFVCNIGDMLDRLTGGWYRSTPHRVRNTSGNERLSFPFFFDPDFAAEVPPLPGRAERAQSGPAQRWDGQDLRAFTGTYGDYLVAKVGKVFPELIADVNEDA